MRHHTLSRTLRPFLLILVAIAVVVSSPEKLFGTAVKAEKGERSLPAQELVAQRGPRSVRGDQEEPPVVSPLLNPREGPVVPTSHPSLITQFVALTLMALAPFILMLLTSFIKMVVVLSLLRSALGAQQAPPNQVINGVAFMLSLYIMFPTGVKMYDAAKDKIEIIENQTEETALVSKETADYVIAVTESAREPLRDFLRKNSSVKHQKSFYRTVYRTIPDNYRDTITPTDFLVLVPAYITSQLKDAFEIGVLIYIPFFVIDLVTANILLAMGMMMLSPVTISMPLKLFLLVMLDGWTLLIQGLIMTFKN